MWPRGAVAGQLFLVTAAAPAPPRVALIGDEGAARQIAPFLTTGGWEFVVPRPAGPPPNRSVLDRVGVVVASWLGGLLLPLPPVPGAVLYQCAWTGIESHLAAIPESLTVTNCHGADVAIAEYVMAGILGWDVGFSRSDAAFRRCTWRTHPPGSDCSARPPPPGAVWPDMHREAFGQTVGLIGYGHIGEEVAKRAAAFGMRVIATTLDPPAQPPPPLAWIGGDEDNARLAREADFVVLACPGTPSTRGLFGAPLIAAMKPTGVLVNIARGAVVDEDALYAALNQSRIGGAILDVWWDAHAWVPDGGVGPASWPADRRFDLLPNVVMTPHSSAHTAGTIERGHRCVAANLDNYALGRPFSNVVRLRNNTGA